MKLSPDVRGRTRLRRGVARARRRAGDDRGLVEGVEQLYGLIFLIIVALFFMEVGVWWHARNILEQSAGEGARVAAAADATCAEGTPAAQAMAAKLGGNWVRSVAVECADADTVQVTVSASTPMFLFPAALSVSARATAPEEGG
jgi:Flp pilus assembly protein TadG